MIFFKIALALILILLIYDILFPKYLQYKELKEKKKRQEAFKNKMKELEIKWISNRLVIFKKH